MKKFISAMLSCLMVIMVSLSFVGCKPKTSNVDSLVVYNWADYIYDYEDDFKTYYKNLTGKNIKITYVTFDTNETMIAKITKGDSKIDVMCPSEYAIQKLMEMDYLLPLNYFSENVEDYIDVNSLNGYVHNSGNIEPSIIEKINEGFSDIEIKKSNGETVKANMTDYMVPYMYGTLGILYNKEEFKKLGIYDKEILNTANWGILFNDSGKRDGDGNIIPLSEGLTGSILMKDSIRDSYAATIFYLLESGKLEGLSMADGTKYTDLSANELINTVDDNLIELCKEVLTNQKSELFGYEVDFGKDDLLKGNAYVDLAWSGDALYAVEESWNDSLNDGEGDYELAYFVPNSYGNIWFDGWVVPKTYNPEHLDAIKIFINFLNSPYVASQNMLTIGYSSAVSREKVMADEEARATLTQAYFVNAPEYYEFSESELAENGGEFDYDSWEEFEEYFFSNFGEMDDSNWRYPFNFAENEDNDYERTIDNLGVMHDFGNRNNDVITMWNYARSAGVSALPMFLIFMLILAGACGIVALTIYLMRRKNMYVKIKKQWKVYIYEKI